MSGIIDVRRAAAATAGLFYEFHLLQGFADLWRNLWLLIASMLLRAISAPGLILPDRSSPEGAHPARHRAKGQYRNSNDIKPSFAGPPRFRQKPGRSGLDAHEAGFRIKFATCASQSSIPRITTFRENKQPGRFKIPKTAPRGGSCLDTQSSA